MAQARVSEQGTPSHFVRWVTEARDFWGRGGSLGPAQTRRIRRVYGVVLPMFCAVGVLSVLNLWQRDPWLAAAWSYQVLVTLVGSLLLHRLPERAQRVMQAVFALLVLGFLGRIVLTVGLSARPEVNLFSVTGPVVAGAVVSHTLFAGDAAERLNKGLAMLVTAVAALSLSLRASVEPEQVLSIARISLCAFAMTRLTDFMSDLQRDHSRLRTEHAVMQQLALSDVLTGLSNRRAAEALLAREAARAERHGGALSVIMVDIDQFKTVNDSRGHEAGDCALKAVAELLRQQVRTSDEPTRWAGDEFLVVLPSTPVDGALIVAERLRRAVAEQADGLTISLGVGALDAGKEDLKNLLGRIDRAVYRAKAGGRNRAAMASQNRRGTNEQSVMDGPALA